MQRHHWQISKTSIEGKREKWFVEQYHVCEFPKHRHKICIFPGMYICGKNPYNQNQSVGKAINYIYGVWLPRWKGKRRCRSLGSLGRQAAKSRHLRQSIISSTHSSAVSDSTEDCLHPYLSIKKCNVSHTEQTCGFQERERIGRKDWEFRRLADANYYTEAG